MRKEYRGMAIALLAPVVPSVGLLSAFLYDLPPYFMVAPSPRTQMLMVGRAVLYAVVGIASSVVVAKTIWSEVFTRVAKVWAIPVLAMATCGLLFSSQIENGLRPIRCCGDGPYTEWGYPYGWIRCWGLVLCRADERAGLDWFALLANVLFWVHAAICVIGIARYLLQRLGYASTTGKVES